MKIHRLGFLLVCLVALLVSAGHPAGASVATRADKVVVIKNQHRLLLMKNGAVLKSYAVALGRRGGAKLSLGDRKTPEGDYVIDFRNSNSRFYKALHISYPNSVDLARARKAGTSPGGAVMIHGLPKGFEDLGTSQATYDWTKGCIAVSNAEMDEIWRLVPNGTPIQIRP